jgi:cyclophilin family peptidyl-prolyl cis-trans isomerase
MTRTLLTLVTVAALSSVGAVRAQERSPGAGPTIVLETVKGVIELETYPEEAPKTVARILSLVRGGFYDGQRFHRADPDFVIQVGDPASRELAREEWWGRGGSGTPIGAAEITRKRLNVRGAVGMGHSGDPKSADSQFYVTLRAAPDLDGKYTVFGRVIRGMDVVLRIERGDVLTRAYVKEEAAGS